MLYLVEFLPTDNSKIRQEEHRVRGQDQGTEFKHMVDALGCTFKRKEKLQKRRAGKGQSRISSVEQE